MTLSRRRLLELSALGIPAAALARQTRANAAQATSHPLHESGAREVAAVSTGVLIHAEGLGVMVLSGHTDQAGKRAPKAAALALMDPSSLTLEKTVGGVTSTVRLPFHYSTLAVRRAKVDSSSTAVPVAVDLDNAFYSLAGMNVAFAMRNAAESDVTPAFAVSDIATSDPCAAGFDLQKWNSLQWHLPLSALDGSSLAKNWRDSKYVQALLEFNGGSVEDKTIEVTELNGREWTLKDKTTRVLKESMSILFDVPAVMHITLTPRAGATAPTTIVVDGSKERATLSIRQLPVPFAETTGDPGLDDLLAYLGVLDDYGTLFARNSKGQCLPTFKDNICGGQTPDCTCCPFAYAYDDAWK